VLQKVAIILPTVLGAKLKMISRK